MKLCNCVISSREAIRSYSREALDYLEKGDTKNALTFLKYALATKYSEFNCNHVDRTDKETDAHKDGSVQTT